MIDAPIRDAFGLAPGDPIVIQFVDFFVQTVTTWPVLSAVVFAGLAAGCVTVARS